jgi:hypothetical protein
MCRFLVILLLISASSFSCVPYISHAHNRPYEYYHIPYQFFQPVPLYGTIPFPNKHDHHAPHQRGEIYEHRWSNQQWNHQEWNRGNHGYFDWGHHH